MRRCGPSMQTPSCQCSFTKHESGQTSWRSTISFDCWRVVPSDEWPPGPSEHTRRCRSRWSRSWPACPRWSCSHERADLYWGRKALRAKEIVPTTGATNSMREKERVRTVEKWKLLDHRSMRDSHGAVQPLLTKWIDRECGVLSYRMRQVLTGRGCFGEYLRQIGKEATGVCYHCDNVSDTAWHTLTRCPTWDEERRVLVAHIGGILLYLH